MRAQYVTELPFGYDEQTTMGLTPDNEVTITHPILQPMIYDQTVMRWVPIALEPASHG